MHEQNYNNITELYCLPSDFTSSPEFFRKRAWLHTVYLTQNSYFSHTHTHGVTYLLIHTNYTKKTWTSRISPIFSKYFIVRPRVPCMRTWMEVLDRNEPAESCYKRKYICTWQNNSNNKRRPLLFYYKHAVTCKIISSKIPTYSSTMITYTISPSEYQGFLE